ncbi:CHAT domain-containing protein, partial [Spinactinospora alkalitolerans]
APLGPPTLAAPRPGHARALRALAAGDRAAVRRELRRALAGSDRAPAAAGHLETAAHARASVAELARLGAEMALSCGDATEALEWLEWPERAGETAPAARRCRDAGWLRLLDRYRAAHVRAAAGDEAAGAELYDLETRLGLAQWHPGCPAPAVGAPSSGPVTHGIAAALDRRAFVRYTRLRGAPVAITLVDGRARAHPLPTAPALGDAIDTLLHAARRDVTAPGTGAGPLTAERAALVARLLVEPVADAVADRPLVIAPPPEAQALPWGLLPGLRGRPVSIVASGRAWLRCRRRRLPRTPRVLLVAGAGLPGAEAEIEALRRERPGARVLSGARAHASALVRELGRADLAHVTAHGGVPADAPMRSGISLAGGPLFAYDLERVPRPPALTVLSSCAVGRSVPSPTGVPLGLGAALLACGGGTVIASVLPVPDIGTAAAMVRLHAALRSGAPASRAVADHLAGSGFVCFGAG